MIRLIAALQVLILHHFGFFFNNIDAETIKWVERLIWNFPGVNVFFIVSGYLILQSLERNQPLAFLKKRLKRIYPALLVCFLLTVALLIFLNSLTFQELLSKDFAQWTAAQLTIFQFYNPEIVRDFGISPPNGALWTISVELQFYIFIALLWYLSLRDKSKKQQNLTLLLWFVLSALYNYLFNRYLSPESLVFKLSFVFVGSYLYFFLAGAFIYINRVYFIEKFEGRALLWISIFLLTNITLDYFNVRYHRYVFNFLSFAMLILLIGLIFSLAYTRTDISNKLLNGNDISYGIYIYQMPVINLFVHLHLNTTIYEFLLSMVLCVVLGILSWFLVEKRVLKR